MNSEITLNISEFHWVTQILDTMDAGLVVLDRDYVVSVWNSFMQSYSGVLSQDIIGKNLFDAVPDLPQEWLKNRVKTALTLETRTFSSWENRPYLFRFHNFSPVSHGSSYMYQDVVITPLRDLSGEIGHIALQINDVSEIALNKIHLRETNQHLSDISRKDGLTGLLNRAFWEQKLRDEYNLRQFIEGKSSLVIFDIDHFKKINDTYGHNAGDEVIKYTADVLRKTARVSDFCGRYGGEEFTVLLPNTTADQAKYFAERLRKRIAAEILNVDGKLIRFTVSLGVCEYRSNMLSHIDWLKKVDRALYHSKENGRNQTTIID
ncbi:diguanylate cyclase [Vibrio sp. SM6]|uniref:diguanylate cyclase n=1 Tax=Vibrio agarilyticus TaxID=2726741 RepID=A0A7X8YGL1_9VIBR|nr:diguanylate cyclase [Vibrio agarilyticus]NLS12655.1 diguanylate cyclase [Vibrio agarilyticus]